MAQPEFELYAAEVHQNGTHLRRVGKDEDRCALDDGAAMPREYLS
jgi:hypothetical protein